jgi:hypothetical protein
MNQLRLLLTGVACLGAIGAVMVIRAETSRQDSPSTDDVLVEVHPQRVRIGATGLSDIAARSPVPVRVGGPGLGRGSVRIRAGLVDKNGAAHWFGRAESPSTDARRLHRLAVRKGAARLASTCAEQWLVVELRDGSTLLSRSRRLLRPEPPDCARFFPANSAWNRPLPADEPIDPRSAGYVQSLRAQVQRNFDQKFYPNINTTSFSVPIYVVPANQPRVPVRLVGGATQWGQGFQRAIRAGVPIPPHARPAAGSDSHIVIYQPSTDTMWEFWTALRRGAGWEAGWGGVMHRVSQSAGHFQAIESVQTGATATSLPLVGGLITLRDLRRRKIDHALAIAIPDSRHGVWSRPAQRSDGPNPSPDAIPAGARFRLDPDLDIDALHLPPFTAMLAKAAQRYGILVRDTSPAVTFYAQDPTPTGSNPWQAALGSDTPEILRRFPWDRLQVTRTELWTYSDQRVAR